MQWGQNARVDAPTENPTKDYLSFGFQGATTFNIPLNTEKKLFSFQNSGACLGALQLIVNGVDPFDPPTGNSQNTNPGNAITILGAGGDAYTGNYGTGANACPVSNVLANDDTKTITGSTLTNIIVLANDINADGTAGSLTKLSAPTIVTQPSKGTATIKADGSIDYLPNNGATGTDFFVYKICDKTDANNCDNGTVNITINPASSGQCGFTTTGCEGDTLELSPDDLVTFANFKWYYGSISTGNEITAANAASFNVVAADFTSNFPKINVISGGGTYILTSNYAATPSCSAYNDTIVVNFNPSPIYKDTTLLACENTLGSGIGTFNLANASNSVSQSAAGTTVSYHSSIANAKSNSNALPLTYTSADAVIYARIERTSTGCYSIAAVTLDVQALPNLVTRDTSVCESKSVNLASLVTENNTVGTMTYYGSLANAISGTSALASSTISANATKTYYVKKTTTTGCTAIDSIVVTVSVYPDFTLVKPTACPGTSEEVQITNLVGASTLTAMLQVDSNPYVAYPDPAVLTGLSVGLHDISVKNAAGCIATKSISINPATIKICSPVSIRKKVK
jgi:hypothetical protein